MEITRLNNFKNQNTPAFKAKLVYEKGAAKIIENDINRLMDITWRNNENPFSPGKQFGALERKNIVPQFKKIFEGTTKKIDGTLRIGIAKETKNGERALDLTYIQPNGTKIKIKENPHYLYSGSERTIDIVPDAVMDAKGRPQSSFLVDVLHRISKALDQKTVSKGKDNPFKKVLYGLLEIIKNERAHAEKLMQE